MLAAKEIAGRCYDYIKQIVYKLAELKIDDLEVKEFWQAVEEGTFRFPTVTSQTWSVQVTAQDLSLLLWGIDPSNVKRQKRYVRPASTASRDLG